LEKLAAHRRANGMEAEDQEDELEEQTAREWIVGALLDALALVPADLIKRAFVDNGIVGGSTDKISSQLYNIKI
jgi:hypothetical protein